MMVGLTLACIFAAVQHPVLLPLNNACSIFRDINSITLDASTRILTIELWENRTCVFPTFVVRLSGTALYKLALVQELELLDGNMQFQFSYPNIVDSGVYFFEVLVVYCQKINFENLTALCVVPPTNRSNILTDTMPVTLTSYNSIAHGRWVLPTTEVAVELPSRYQRRNCTHEIYYKDWCNFHVEEVVQHMKYNFVEPVSVHETFRKLTELLRKIMIFTETPRSLSYSELNFCFVGDSHAKMMELALQTAITQYQAKRLFLPVNVTYYDMKFPYDFRIDSLSALHCSVVIMSAGQWPISHQAKVPYSLSQLQRELTAMVLDVVSPVNKTNATLSLFLRSENYAAYGAFTDCPTNDYRKPPVFDAINAMVKAVAGQLAIHYVDLNDIMGPMWDSALDYNHPYGKVADMEVRRILHSVLSVLLAPGGNLSFAAKRKIDIKKEHRAVMFFPSQRLYIRRRFTHLSPIKNQAEYNSLRLNSIDIAKLSDHLRWLFVFDTV
jgi:hypothetical protein